MKYWGKADSFGISGTYSTGEGHYYGLRIPSPSFTRGATTAWWNFRYKYTLLTPSGSESILYDTTSTLTIYFYPTYGTLYIATTLGGLSNTYTISGIEGAIYSVTVQYNGGEGVAGDRFKVYYDATEQTRATAGAIPTNLQTDACDYIYYGVLNTTIYELRIGTGILTNEERLLLYNNGFGQQQSLRGIISGLRNEWLLTEGTGTIVKDSVGGLHGAFFGTPTWVPA